MTREDAILCLKGVKNYARDTFTEQTDLQASLDLAIKALEQEPKTGHWITCDVLQEVKCSECRACSRYITKYCPNCAAKMESEAKKCVL